MAMDFLSDFPRIPMDHRPRKRQRWDVQPEVQTGVLYGLEAGFVDLKSFLSLMPSSTTCSSDSVVERIVQQSSDPLRVDDKDGHLVFAVGEDLTSRYKIHRKLGEGAFGQVLECWDRENREMVAIKVVHGLHNLREAAMIEIDVLYQLKKHANANCCFVQIRNWFDYHNHICIVFEKLGPSLYDFLRKNGYHPFPIDVVREIGRQLLNSISFMHDLHLIHTDLKPENILFVSPDYIKVGSSSTRIPKSNKIKVIDFGSTAYNYSHNHNYVVSTRHYRAPEVILGSGWSYPCDIWSVGCILVELCSGETLFQTHKNLEHLAMMERILGPLPEHVLRRTVVRRADKYLKRGRLNWPNGAVSRESIKTVSNLSRLQNLVMRHVDHSAGDLIDLLRGLLKYDPEERLTAHEALLHPFFLRNKSRS